MPRRKNNEVWLETMLRLKLNTVEMEQTVTYPDYKLEESVSLLRKYGLILSSYEVFNLFVSSLVIVATTALLFCLNVISQ